MALAQTLVMLLTRGKSLDLSFLILKIDAVVASLTILQIAVKIKELYKL